MTYCGICGIDTEASDKIACGDCGTITMCPECKAEHDDFHSPMGQLVNLMMSDRLAY